jgi:diaminopimelate epimerase
MARPLVVEFTKMDGAGNDFIVIDNRFYAFNPGQLSALALRFCNRYTGVGGDGLLALCQPDEAGHAFRMRYFNADGTLGTMCGNGARCLAAFAYESGLGEGDLVFGSDAGVMRARRAPVASGGHMSDVEIELPRPRGFSKEAAPALEGETGIAAAGYVWTGTEHVVYEVLTGLDEFAVDSVGPAIRMHPNLQPAGANVNFVERCAAGVDDCEARVRTYEKGVEAETRACGTGAVAVAICGSELGWWGAGTVRIQMPGGMLRVLIPKPDGEPGGVITLAGPTRVAFRGSFEIDPEVLAKE